MTHPKIEEQYEVDGWSKDAGPDKETFFGLQNAKFLLSSPADRISALQNLDRLISADDGTSLRAKSELFELRRELSKNHQAQLKVGR